MNWLHYLLEANIYLAILYVLYFVFLNKETYYTLNRIYLLLSCVIAFVLPLVQINMIKSTELERALPAVIMVNTTNNNVAPAPVIKATAASFGLNLSDAIVYLYLIGAGILLVLLAVKIAQLVKLIKVKNAAITDSYKIVYIEDSNTAFSFFNYLFIGKNIEGQATIIRHELVHIRQKHSVDIVLLEVFKIVNWFNPFIYLLQNSLKAVHEYIADEQTAALEADTIAYSTFLVSNAYGLSGSPLANSFFNYNLLKKRINMLHQKRSGSLARLKYLLAIPVCSVLLCISSMSFSKDYALIKLGAKHTLGDTSFVYLPKPFITNKGYNVEEKAYQVNGKTYFSATITDEGGKKFTIYKGQGNASGEAMIYDQYGYKFPDYKVTPVKNPPPPPPPMMVGDTTFNALTAYANTALAYPKKARENEITGNVIAKFTINARHKITGVRILNSVGFGCDEAVIKMLKSFPGVINGKYPDYLVAISFDLFGRTKSYPLKRDEVDDKIIAAPNFAMGIGLTDYGK